MAKSYRTAKGRMLNMEELRAANEGKVAAGNAKLNARGDKLGPGGSIAERVAERARKASTAQPSKRTSIKPPVAKTMKLEDEPENTTPQQPVPQEAAVPVGEQTATEVAYEEEMDEEGNIVVKKVPAKTKKRRATRKTKGGDDAPTTSS